MIDDVSRLHLLASSAHPYAEIETEDIVPAERYDVRATVRLHPAKCSVHQRWGDLRSAMVAQDGEEADLEQARVAIEAERLTVKILIDRVLPTGRRDAHETGNLAIDRRYDVGVEVVQLVAESFRCVYDVLAELTRVHYVAKAVNDLALRVGRNADFRKA
jgi:hypothetical protein